MVDLRRYIGTELLAVQCSIILYKTYTLSSARDEIIFNDGKIQVRSKKISVEIFHKN